ncbi:unnamed protein product [Brachionus calyciflorus]|uniref:ATRX n=1 Tax=Brachionus calyciflorus TaxID=104777 RepID=A0A813TEA8_9BILA|nr:unnamed protein product [Brachionus calyciflorus]
MADINNDVFDPSEILTHLEMSQNIFNLGNDLNNRIDNFKLEIDILQKKFQTEINNVKLCNQILITKLNRLKENKTIDNSPQSLIQNEEIPNDFSSSETNMEVDKGEDEAFTRILSMMQEEENTDIQSESIPDQIPSELTQNDSNECVFKLNEIKKSVSLQSIGDCTVKVKRLSLECIKVLSKDSEKLIKLNQETDSIDRFCNLDLDKFLQQSNLKTDLKKSESSSSSNKKAKSKSESEDEANKESSLEEDDNEKLDDNLFDENPVEDDQIKQKEDLLFEMMQQDEQDNGSINENSSDSDNESLQSKIDRRTAKKSENSNKKENNLEPDLKLNLNDLITDDESPEEENSKSKADNSELPVIDLDVDSGGDDTLVEDEVVKKSVENKSDDEEIIPKRRAKRLTSSTSDELVKESSISSSDDDDDVIIKKKTKLPYLKGILASDLESNTEENKENILSEEKSSKKRKRVRLKNSDSESSEQSSSKSRVKSKLKKIKKELDEYSESAKSSDDEEEEEEVDSDVISIHSSEEETPSKDVTRHKIRTIIGDEKLKKETQDAIQAERERKKRLEEKRALELSISEEKEDIYLDIDSETKNPIVKVDPAISKNLKPHQVEGIKFMWDSCYEKCEMIKEGHKGSGCLLAHCMGLGKTFQVIAFVHTLLTNKDLTKCKRVLILLPVNVQTNWRKEFRKWTKHCKNQISVYELPNDKGFNKDLTRARLNELENWHKRGGVMLLGYTMFARLVGGKAIKPKKLEENFNRCLLAPGADLVICDEGHMLKTQTSNLNKSVSQIETERRIVLTGTPLQNNLIEYHCMVSFVKPNLLGTTKEFKNRFVNPINNGQHRDSTEADVRYMKKRAHILHNLLDGCVQRKDYNVIRNLLKPKKEYVLSIRLSDRQIELYRAYIDHRGINANNISKMKGAQLFSDYQNLFRVWTHPWILKLNEVRVLKAEEKAAEKNFLANDDEDEMEEGEEEDEESILPNNDDDDIQEIGSIIRPKRTTRKSSINGGGVNSVEIVEKKPPERWWTSIVADEDEFEIALSGKLVLLEQILKLCKRLGDKLLLFSQSLLSLDLIEKFLDRLNLDKKDQWRKDIDYFRMDGSTDVHKRQSQVDRFNDEDNHRARLFLISTKAGGIGINLIGANRCIIFDASWNPSYDTQSIFRIYRFGQTKDVFVYRFLAQGTMEEKIYQRQVTKQSLSQRVIDEHQIDRHFTSQEINELYKFDPDVWNASNKITYDIPEDEMLKSLLVDCKRWIFKYHEHDSLLENKLNEGLSEEDRKAAWEEYENEKRHHSSMHNTNLNDLNFNPNSYTAQNTDSYVEYLLTLADQEQAANRPHEQLRANALQIQKIHNAQREKLQNDLLRQSEESLQQQARLNQQYSDWQTMYQNQMLNQHLNPLLNMQNLKTPNRQGFENGLMSQSQYLQGILSGSKSSSSSSTNPQGLTMVQKQKSNSNDSIRISPYTGAQQLINKHRKQISRQTFSPQQPTNKTPNRNPVPIPTNDQNQN